jgi:4-hydroxy-3-polyprenylbenzoate decarboxylase
MDVLDHSCSKLGFGGKMCIDGTYKFEEETDENHQLIINNEQLKIDLLLKEKFGEIKAVNSSLLSKQIPCLIISVKKNRKEHIKELHKQICSLKEIAGVNMILYVEHTVDANDLPTALWRFCNNLDPKEILM